MIRIVLQGRTANILFQYALGRVLSEKHRVPLLLDASWYNRQGWSEIRGFLELPLRARVIRPITPVSLASRALLKLTGKHHWEYLPVRVLKEQGNDHTFDTQFTQAPSNCVLKGYFQSSRYFDQSGDALRMELKPLIETGARISHSEEASALMLKPGSVAVHVRRGDYLHHPAFAVCDRDYYQKSMETMRSRVPNTRFFVFSDDPDWCREEFRDADTEIVESVMKNPLHDLHLMSTASHHIIANSSYSWWAAWLGDKPGQEVIMPDRWFTSGIMAPISEKRWK